MKRFQSKHFLDEDLACCIIVFLIICDLITSSYISNFYYADFKKVVMVIYFLLFFISLYYTLYDTHSRKQINKELEALKWNTKTYIDIKYHYAKDLAFYQRLSDELQDNKNFIHEFKLLDKLFDVSNIVNCINLIVILFGLSFSSYFYKPFGVWIFVLMFVPYLLFCLFGIAYDVFKNHKFTGISVGTGILFFFLLCVGKQGYIRGNGENRMGSFFEKHSYTAKYFVLISPGDNQSKNYKVLADIYAYEKDEDVGEYFDGSEKTEQIKYYTIKRAHFKNGRYLDFNDCQMSVGENIECTDQHGKSWQIELTNEVAK